ncbi:MAG: CoA pyrophosphatase [Planktomarina sp.]
MLLTKADLLTALGRDGDATSDFDLNVGGTIAPTKDAAVLVPIMESADGLRLILTKRAAHLKAHPGQVAFPGGRRDDTDKDLIATALREADEEIGLPPARVQVLGGLPHHDTVTAFRVTPVVGWIERDWTVQADPGEVAEVFHVPLGHVLNLKNYSIQSRQWRGAARYFYTIPYGPYYIWGATARMLHGLAARCAA